jgi:hypothetical protein
MDELWTWLYTDELGKRRIYPGKLSEEEAKRLKDATRLEGTLEGGQLAGSDSEVPAGKKPAVEGPADLLTVINRAILIVSRLRDMSRKGEPDVKTLLAELSNELAEARMHLALLRARLAELEKRIGH